MISTINGELLAYCKATVQMRFVIKNDSKACSLYMG